MATELKEFTYTEVEAHDSKESLYVVVHDGVYDVTKFLLEHPGGEEVILDIAGQDATEAFEDVGHSDEAREILEGTRVGNLKRGANDPKPRVSSTNSGSTSGESSSGGIPTIAYAVIAAAAAAGVYQYLQLQKQSQA